ncbi:delta-lactam-biosynthetic de-N-acetylase [Paenibacillus anaericanus]|uniref:Delta-lactam-biosynthetic de-N-acetylase n=1 Tax=Paenibacillus anaericanus TaxID=170367 RepID=A0A3S1DRG9_9BACL|nr:delta-lactam-biosynthetic de-N-acetylase [Paenibacillus anaericanus]RUT43797.1 delta-lactam-biosynthetic de-N-acetylase [Paenibacillus anaericanus]
MKHALISVVMVCLLFALSPVVAMAGDSGVVSAADGAFHFGFKRSVDGKLPSINEEGFKSIVDKHGAVFLGDTTRKEMFLTFDNGYENGYTPAILDTLKAKKVPAIFFVTGHYVKDQPALVKRMAIEGHLIGNHSWSHPDMSTISDAKIKEELESVKQGVTAITGNSEMTYLRPPRGIFNERTLRVTKELGYTNVFWSAAYKDWDVKAQKGSSYAFQKVVSQFHPGAVLLLHSISADNTEALGAIIDEARRQGYQFKSLNQLHGDVLPFLTNGNY